MKSNKMKIHRVLRTLVENDEMSRIIAFIQIAIDHCCICSSFHVVSYKELIRNERHSLEVHTGSPGSCPRTLPHVGGAAETAGDAAAPRAGGGAPAAAATCAAARGRAAAGSSATLAARCSSGWAPRPAPLSRWTYSRLSGRSCGPQSPAHHSAIKKTVIKQLLKKQLLKKINTR